MVKVKWSDVSDLLYYCGGKKSTKREISTIIHHSSNEI